MLGQKNYKWIWTSVDREAREYVDFHLGSRGTETDIRLWNRVKDFVQGFVMTDYWKLYKKMIPPEQLIQSKEETYTVESYNGINASNFKHFPYL